MFIVPKEHLHNAVKWEGPDFKGYPVWVRMAIAADKMITIRESDGQPLFYTEAMAQPKPIHLGDWLCITAKGRYYMLSDEMMNELFEPVELNFLDPYSEEYRGTGIYGLLD